MSDNSTWWTLPMVGFDLETTGTDALHDRVVTAAFVLDSGTGAVTTTTFLLNPGIDIPKEASDVHGITTEHATEHGTDYREGILALRNLITQHSEHMPIVAFNGAFDFTMLTAECQRLDIPAPLLRVVLDPLVMDRVIDKYRRGSRTLTSMSQHYGVRLDNAHAADADALAAVLLARAILNRVPTPSTPEQFHTTLRTHRAIQQTSLQAHLRRTKQDPTIVCDPGWPIYDALAGA